jgi:hypothetical protein
MISGSVLSRRGTQGTSSIDWRRKVIRWWVINTMKFKVINESVKKTDKHDAATMLG